MRLPERYRRLTLWNKVGFWGSVASIVGIAIAVIPFLPWSKPRIAAPAILGPAVGVVGESYTFAVKPQKKYVRNVRYGVRFDNDTSPSWTDFVNPEMTVYSSHSFATPGEHLVEATVQDRDGTSAIAQTHVFVTATEAASIRTLIAPFHVEAAAPSEAKVGEKVVIVLRALDGGSVAFGVDLNNDGVVDEYTPYAESGRSIEFHHVFSAEGDYVIPILAKSPFNSYSAPVVVRIHVSR